VQAGDICFLSISEAARLLSDKELSPVELVSAHLERIAETDGRLNSFITLLEDESMAAARAAEADIVSGGYRGPLHGIPIGLKDLFYTRGVRTTVGSKIMGDFVPDEDATVTRLLDEAGAILLGKLQMHEFAFGATSANPHYGPAHNPWDTERVTGGSSGGSGSSVASGQCMGALGTDTGGSVRIPAALCGIVGLKPTFGRVGRSGVFPLSWSQDTVGPMCRTVRDVALMLNVIAGHDPRDPSSSPRPSEDFTATLEQGVDGARIGIPREFFFDGMDPEVKDAVTRAARVLEGLGASVGEVSVPMAAQSAHISPGIIIPEGAEVHLDNLRNRAEEFDPVVRTRLETGVLTTATQYLKAQRARMLFNQQMAHAMEGVDALLTPTVPIGAPAIGDEMAAAGDTSEPVLTLLARLTRPFNLGGLPTVTLPCGFTSDGLPIGLQLAGRPFEETTVLRIAYAYEQATEWHERRPPL
jgi:aspartyl-tRNA(Asn)/glutamyl-tRNA(Gln) amidotransferase subunit A